MMLMPELTRPVVSYRLACVEVGYAEVVRTDTGKRVGKVSEEKAGSTRTGTRWTAYSASGRDLGAKDTRAAAVALVEARHRVVLAHVAAVARCDAEREA